MQTIDLGPVEDFLEETGDDDETTGADDDDAGQLDDDDAGGVPGGCADAGCAVAGAESSEDAAPFFAGGIAGFLTWARRRRRKAA